MVKNSITIIQDTREQRPLRFPEGVVVKRDTLTTGDYSILGWEHSFCVERKSLADFAGTMVNGYEPNTQKPRRRFNNELERMKHYDFSAIVVTATPQEVIDYRYNCGKPSNGALWGFALSVLTTYGVPVMFLHNDTLAARWIYDAARHFLAVRTKKNRTRE